MPELARYCDGVGSSHTARSFPRQVVAAVRGLIAGRPLATTTFFSDELAAKIVRIVTGGDRRHSDRAFDSRAAHRGDSQGPSVQEGSLTT